MSRFFVLLVLALAIAAPARADVVWEDYQGNNDILGTSNQDKAGPFYANNGGNVLPDLRAIAADINNATRTGTSANIDYGKDLPTLCNTSNNQDGSYDAAGTGQACQADAQGRVIYALVKFPQAGNYTFSFAHDDDIDVGLSSDYANTSYRTASYNLPVGTAASYTTGETDFENIAGVFSSPSANACILLRVYWSNAGGREFLRMRWTKPSGAIEIVPASQLFNPGLAASAIGCTGTLVSTATSIQVKKVIASSGRAAAADQFALTLVDSTNSAVVTSGQTGGTALVASTGTALVTNGRTYLVSEQMAAGSSFSLAAYTPTIACTRSGTAFTPSGSAPTWSVATTAVNQQIVCTITNTRKSATLQLRKTWVGAVVSNSVTIPATSGFSANTLPLLSVANAANETDNGTGVTVLVGDSGTLGAETFVTGSASAYGSVLSCSSGTPSGTDGQAANTFVIPEAAGGGTVTCTYTNTYRMPMTVAKSSTLVSDPFNGTTNPKAIPGALLSYCVLITNPNSIAATGVIGTDTMPTTVTYVPGSIRSGTTCANAATVEDDNATGADESDPVGASVSGTTLTFTTPSLAAAASVAFVFGATVN